MVTLKFGGTSVADAPALARLCAIVSRECRPRVVVVSALSGVTDQLIAIAAAAGQGSLADAVDGIGCIRGRHEAMAQSLGSADRRARLLEGLRECWIDLEALARAAAILRETTPAGRDAIVACGELASSRLVAAALEDAGVPAVWVDARTVVATDGRHERAVAQPGPTADRAGRILAPLLDRGRVPVVGGFIGSAADGTTTTLGRGGSDYSAALIGACLASGEIQIWTDTDGVLTADPRLVPSATTIDRLSFGEASALAHFGAKVLHPATIAPAVAGGIPVRVLNSRQPEHPGTVIVDRPAGRRSPLAGLACVPGCVELHVPLPSDAGRGLALARVFETCAAHGATVYLSDVRPAQVSLILAPAAAADAVAAACSAVRRHDGRALLVAVGDGLADGRALARAVIRALGGATVAALSDASGSGYVALAVPESELAAAMAAAHARFFTGAPGKRRSSSREARAASGDLVTHGAAPGPAVEARL